MTVRQVAVRLVREGWPWLLTAAVVGTAILIFFESESLERAAEVGEFISGFSAMLAFLWLIVGLRSQAGDLALQREELALQRVTLEKQAKELRNAAKFESLSRIEAMMETCDAKIQAAGIAAKSHGDLSTTFLAGVASWKEMLESRDPARVQSLYLEWIKIEGAARRYVATVANALKMYMEHNLDTEHTPQPTDEEFVYVHSTFMRQAPYLSEHEAAAFMVANNLFLYAPGLESLRVAGLFAVKKQAPFQAFKEGALEEMREQLRSKDYAIPAIALD